MEETGGPNAKPNKSAQNLKKASWPMNLNDIPQVQMRDQIGSGRSNLDPGEVSEGSKNQSQFVTKTFESLQSQPINPDKTNITSLRVPSRKKSTLIGDSQKKGKGGKSGHDTQQNAKGSYISKKERERRKQQLKALPSEAWIPSSSRSRNNSNVSSQPGPGLNIGARKQD